MEAKHKHKSIGQIYNQGIILLSYIPTFNHSEPAAAGTGRRPALGGMVTGAAERHLNDLNKHIHTQLLICKFPSSLAPSAQPIRGTPTPTTARVRSTDDPSGSPHGKFHLTLVGILSLPCLSNIYLSGAIQ